MSRRTRGSASDALVEVWRLLASGREDEARAKLAGTWSYALDALAGEQAVAVALRLLERLAPLTDDLEGLTRLPDRVTVYRAGFLPGWAWTTETHVAESIANQLHEGGAEIVPLYTATVDKRNVLAYIVGYGESEIVVSSDAVNVTETRESARTVQTPVEPAR